MGRQPKLDSIEKKLSKGKDFVLTRQQYINATGTDIPQEKSYTERKSAIARKAREYGYVVHVIPEKLEFKKNE